ncbi:MAG: FAD-dependent oxidoreductase [Parvibaculaceae bacterium]
MSNPHYPRLFEPLRVGPVEVANRLYMTAHGLGYAVPDPNRPGFCLPSDRHVHYYAERAAGGLGLIIQESTVVHPSSEGSAFGYQTATVAAAFDQATVPHFARIAEAVHAHGTKLFMQLWHGGHHADPRWERGGPRKPLLAPSSTPAVESNAVPRAMSVMEIRDVVAGFARSARNARAAGYDGVEIQAAHSALVEQFLSPFYNKRTDAYGGDASGRMRFLREILEETREAAGADFAIGIRLNTDELLPGGLGSDELGEVAERLDEARLLDFFDLDIGTMHTAPLMIAPSFVPTLPAEDFIAALRPAIRHAALLGCPGRMTEPAEAERLVTEGIMDMVGAARTYIAEPEFARNAREGRADMSRRCIACNHCLEGILSGVNCVINPATGREATWGMKADLKALKGRRVVVVGGGPAGLEAARVAAMRGHRVTLFEREAELGGALRQLAALPGRESYAWATDWFSARLAELQVDIRLGQEPTVADIEALGADATIVATGARFEPTGSTGFLSTPIPGWNLPHVYTPERFLDERPQVEGRAVLLDEDGQAAAAGIAEMLAEEAAGVELVTRWQMVAPRLQPNGQFAYVLTRLYAAGVVLTPNTYIKEIGERTVTLFNIFTNEEREVRDVGIVVLAGSRRSTPGLAETPEDLSMDVSIVGDAASPRSLFEACYEGRRAAMAI